MVGTPPPPGRRPAVDEKSSRALISENTTFALAWLFTPTTPLKLAKVGACRGPSRGDASRAEDRAVITVPLHGTPRSPPRVGRAGPKTGPKCPYPEA